MLFVPYRPAYPLSEYVEIFWHVNGRTPYQREKILPTEHIEFIINLGDPHKVFPDSASEDYTLNQDCWVCGLQTNYILTEAVGESNLFGIRFKPGGIYPFFGFPVSEISDNIVEIELIWGRWVAQIREQLQEAPNTQARFHLLAEALLRRFVAEVDHWRGLKFAFSQLANAPQPVTVRDLSEQMGWSQKHLIQQFKKVVGVTPKTLSRIVRFHRMLHTIDPTQPVNWTDIAHQCHYYDQAHFNKDFQAFSGLTPSQYLAFRQKYLDTPPQKGEDVQFVPVA